MLYILLVIFILAFVIGLIVNADDDCDGWIMLGTGVFGSVIFFIALMITLGCYNSTKSTVDKQIAVLEIDNKSAIEKIEPLVDKYLDYESSTYKDLKLEPNVIVGMANYPQLKGNEFVQSQIKIILGNQKRITNLKLRKAKLNSYKMWIFMGE